MLVLFDEDSEFHKMIGGEEQSRDSRRLTEQSVDFNTGVTRLWDGIGN